MENWHEKIKLEDDELVTSYFSNFFNHDISIRFLGTKDNVNFKQNALVNEIIENEDFWIKECITSLLKYYVEAYPHYKIGWKLGGVDEKTIEEYLPKDINVIKLLKLITPAEIYIEPEEACDKGKFGFGLDCEWDIEHGIGVYFDNWKVFRVGGMQVAFG